jgi:hypothetical protein
MEDKELQELFAAKRTAEANRRRQEELRRLLEASAAPEAAPKTRRLWPVWASVAAAAILLLLLTLPVLFRQPEAAPLLMARNETPSPAPQEEIIAPKEEKPTEKQGVTKRKAIAKTVTKEAEYYAEENTPEPDTVIEPETTVAPIAQPEPIETPIASNDEPRIHRRTSSNMVCSNCSITNVPTESTALQNFLVATFGAETLPPLTLKNIEF